MTTVRLARTYETDDGETIHMTAPTPTALNAADLTTRTALLERYVREELGRVLALHPSEIDTTGRPMGCLGIGSITGIELQYRMEATLGVDLNLQRLLLANSAQELIDCLAWQFGAERARKYGTPVYA
ncbi:acyl carrier protein (plasmid) [Streptomyces sp. BI20]|uniref:acyl carrier protein n=1 Tax=Streptomyces sp. BI20 TaxID=3403460 RepID=UPI003C710181